MELGTGPFNFHHLRLFLQVVEQGGVTAGAAAAGVSQPAVSAAVRTLEREVGQPLLERVGRGVRPTEAGQTLADYARRIFALEADGRRALDELRGLERGRLAVGASTTVGIYLMPRLLGRFHSRHPAIGLALDIGNTRQIVEQTRQGALDLAVVEGFVADDDLDVEPYLPDELILVAAPGDPLAVGGPIQPRDLADASFLVREVGSGTRAVVERAFARWGVTPAVAMEIGHTEAIKQAIAAGLGVSILSRLAVARELVAGALVHIPIAAEPIRREFLLVRRRAARPSRAGSAFLAILAQESPVRAERFDR
jgi:DNA-binding transcriptional LysR family regulator